MKKTILISGATAGFGRAMARRFAAEGHRLIITGRRAKRLDDLQEELAKEFNTASHKLSFDVRSLDQCQKAISGLPAEWQAIDVLINNAGLAAGLGSIQDGDTDDWDRMIDTNVKGLLYLSKQVIPLMLARKTGHVINIGSTAGKEVYSKGNVYCASKHAVDALSKGMRIDLLGTGIKVTQIAPGAAETEFSIVRLHGDEAAAKACYDGYEPMSAEDIAEVTHYVTTLPPNLCVNDLVLTSLSQANSFYINRNNA